MKKIFKAIIILGVVLILGTAGLSDNGTAATAVIAKQAFLSIGIISLGVLGLKAYEYVIQIRRKISCQKIQIKSRKYYTC